MKEPDFFARRLGVFTPHDNPSHLRDWDWYRSLWDHAPEGARRGAFSVNLLPNGEDAARKVRRYAPDAKFLVSLREPVARTYSQYIHYWGRFRHWGGIPDSFEEAVFVDELMWRSRYAAQLEPWLRVFPDSRFHFVLDTDMDADPLGSVQEIYRFLDVDDTFEPPTLGYHVNPTKTRRGIYGAFYRASQVARRLGVGPLIDLAKRLGVERTINRLDWRTGKKPPMDPDTERAVRRIFAHDVDRLEVLIERDLSAWREPEARADQTPDVSVPVRETRLQQRPATSRTQPQQMEDLVETR